MREPKVLLTYPPNQLMDIETPRPDGSLGPLYLAGALRQIGIEPDLVDMAVGTNEDTLETTFFRRVMQSNGLVRIGMSWERIRQLLERGHYDIVAINSNFTPQTRMALKVAEIAKRVNPETLVIAGGVNARILWPRFMNTGHFDLICMTEGEKPIQEIARRFMNGTTYEGIDGTIYFRDGKPQINRAREDTIFIDLDELPIPAWDKLPFQKYERIDAPHGVDLTGTHYRYAPIMTSRGCPFQCSYCHISEERFSRGELSGNIGNLRLKSVKRVIQEVDILRSLGAKKLFIEDDSALAKKPRVKEYFTLIRDYGFTIAGVNGVNLVHTLQKTKSGILEPDLDYLRLFHDSGFRQIVCPVESGSQRILDRYATAKLNLASMDVVKLIRTMHEIGIICPVNMMIGFPHETEEEMMMSVELAKRLIDAGADYVTWFIVIPFPGCQLHSEALICPDCKGTHLPRDFDPDIFNWKRPVMINTTVPPERIEEIRDWAWRTVNPSEHVAQRLQNSIGAGRWTYNYEDA